jgi:hypothetical protein
MVAICNAAHSKFQTLGRLYMEQHRTSSGHHIARPRKKIETEAASCGAMAGKTNALWVAACALLLLCSSLSAGESMLSQFTVFLLVVVA